MKLYLAASFLFLSTAALSQSSVLNVVETRQAGFDQMGAITDALKAGVEANSDPKSFISSANALAR
jgi:hypothetical protein